MFQYVPNILKYIGTYGIQLDFLGLSEFRFVSFSRTAAWDAISRGFL